MIHGMIAAGALLAALQEPYVVRAEHPRLLIEDVKVLAQRCQGPLAEDYRIVKERADKAVSSRWATVPEGMLNCALAYLVERELGHDSRKYAEQILREWGWAETAPDAKNSRFGYHALVYDWIYDAMSPEERRRFGDALGSWLSFYTGKAEILLKYGHWENNQTWGPFELSTTNSRDSLTQKLLISLALLGAGTQHEGEARSFLDSWHRRIPAEAIPALDRMGGVWSESYGHGSYGPVRVIPYAFHAWRTATGIDLFRALKPWGFPVEEPRWVAYTMMPHNERTAWIDDGDGSPPGAFACAAPMLRDGLSRWFSDRGREWLDERWQRVSSLDPSIKATPPDGLPLGYLFEGAGHVYVRGAWGDPNALWGFFGAGPQYAGHSRDDEGHFLLSKKGSLVSRQGGQGHNDDDPYSGGSIIYNLVTIFDPEEQFRRAEKNENDGGLLRHVYEAGPYPRERARITAFENAPQFTYAAAQLTRAYNEKKAKEVTRQFLYLRGDPEYVVIFDRVEATRAEYRRHFFLHVPTPPELQGRTLTWLSLPEADGDSKVLSKGRSRAFLQAVLPEASQIVLRGGPGKEAWGHPLEPSAQYNHETPGRKRPPLCPWRIEVGDPGPGAKTLFLHVLEIADESSTRPTPVRFVPPAGIDIGSRWQVRFNPDGELGGAVGKAKLATTPKTEEQYRR